MRAMFILAAIGGLAFVWLMLDLLGERRPRGLIVLESQHSVEMASVWLRLASGYRLIFEDKTRGLFLWERGRRFNDGGLVYYGQVRGNGRTGRAHLVVGVIGHKFHTAEELASARARFVSGQLFHLTERSAEDAVLRASDPRTTRAVHPVLRRLAGQQPNRPPAIDAPMSPSAARSQLHAPLAVVSEAISQLPGSGWRLVETAILDRGFVTQRRYCFEDAPERGDAGAEYLLEVCGYADDYVHVAIDWYPLPDADRTPRRPGELEADVTRRVQRMLGALEPAE